MRLAAVFYFMGSSMLVQFTTKVRCPGRWRDSGSAARGAGDSWVLPDATTAARPLPPPPVRERRPLLLRQICCYPRAARSGRGRRRGANCTGCVLRMGGAGRGVVVAACTSTTTNCRLTLLSPCCCPAGSIHQLRLPLPTHSGATAGGVARSTVSLVLEIAPAKEQIVPPVRCSAATAVLLTCSRATSPTATLGTDGFHRTGVIRGGTPDAELALGETAGAAGDRQCLECCLWSHRQAWLGWQGAGCGTAAAD